MDEGAFWENLSSAWTAAGDASPCRMIITTPPEKVNFAKYLRFSEKIDVKVLNWRMHPHKTQEWYEKECERRTSEEIARELDNNWEGAITGRVYPEISHVRVGDFPYHPDWPLYVSHDPGHDPDPHAMGWFQVNPENGRVRLLECFEGNKKIAPWFGPLFGFPIDSQFTYTPDELALIERVKEWKRGVHYGDPYGRTQNQVTGSSLYSEFQKLFQVYVQSNTKENDLESRKKAARRVLMNLDVNETTNTKYFMECIFAARYPDVGENSNRVTPNDKPIHDWTSHMRTMLDFFGVNFKGIKTSELEPRGATFAKALASVQLKHSMNEEDYL